jgi:putative transposase
VARLARFVLPEHPQHIILKGINNMSLFVEDEDFQHYLKLLQVGCEKHACALHAYVLLPSEIHLLLTPSTEYGVSKLMQMLGRYYVQHFNKKYDRSGTLWEGRYRGTLVDPANYLLKVYRFIESAPVRLDLVEKPDDYSWSSYSENASGLAPDGLLTVHKEYLALSDNAQQQAMVYALLFKAGLSEAEVKLISNSSLKGWVLGSAEYQAEVAALTQRQVAPKPKGGDRRSEKYRESVKAKQQGALETDLNVIAEQELVKQPDVEPSIEVLVASVPDADTLPEPAAEPDPKLESKQTKAQQRKAELDEVQGSLF